MENRADYLFESYFANALTAAEAKELSNLLAENPELAAEMAFQKQVAASVSSASLGKGIQRAEWRSAAQSPFPLKTIKTNLWSRYAYAAAAAIAIFVAAFLFFQSPELETVIADNTGTYTNRMKFKSLGSEPEAVSAEVIAAFALYDKEQYTEASEALQPIAAAQPSRLDYRFYWGVSLVKSKQYREAVAALEPVAQSQDGYRTVAMYYLGLACAGLEDKDCARKNLQAYIDSPEGVTYRKQAQNVLNAL